MKLIILILGIILLIYGNNKKYKNINQENFDKTNYIILWVFIIGLEIICLFFPEEIKLLLTINFLINPFNLTSIIIIVLLLIIIGILKNKK